MLAAMKTRFSVTWVLLKLQTQRQRRTSVTSLLGPFDHGDKEKNLRVALKGCELVLQRARARRMEVNKP